MSRTRLPFFVFLALMVVCATASAQLNFTTTSYPTNGSALGVASGDFNLDGSPDLAVGVASTVQIYLNDGTGHFTAGGTLDAGATVSAIVTADVNNDGNLDLLVVPSTSGTSVPTGIQVWYGNGDGTFGQGPGVVTTLPTSYVAAGDFDEDGFVDLAEIECAVSSSGGCSLSIYRNNGDGTFSSTIRLTSSDVPLAGVVIADFNKDGHLDVATMETSPAHGLVYFGNGDGTFSAPVALTVNNPVPANASESIGALAAGDTNNDAVPDLVLLAGYICGSACGQMQAHTFLSDGQGGFSEAGAPTTVTTSGGGGTVILSDLDGDLTQDLIFWSPTHFGGQMTLWKGAGDGTFTTQFTSNAPNGALAWVLARDLNLDSRHDLVSTDWLGDVVNVSLNNTGAANCTPPGSDAVHARLCTPQDGGTFNGVVSFSGSGNSPAGVQRLELWIDGVKHYETLNDQLLHAESLAAGQHLVELVAVDKYGAIAKTSATITVQSGTGGNCTAAPNTVHLCTPVNGSSVSSQVEISGAANLPSYYSMELYIDDQPVLQVTSASFDQTFTLSAGQHHAVLVGYSGIPDTTDQSYFTVVSGGGG